MPIGGSATLVIAEMLSAAGGAGMGLGEGNGAVYTAVKVGVQLLE
jgi:hypothetical protein